MVRVPLSLISWGTSAAAALSTEVVTSLLFLSLPLSSELEPQPARAIEATIRVAITRGVLRMRVLPDVETGVVRNTATGPASRRGPGRGCDAVVTRGWWSALVERLDDGVVDGVLRTGEPVLGGGAPPDGEDDQRTD